MLLPSVYTVSLLYSLYENKFINFPFCHPNLTAFVIVQRTGLRCADSFVIREVRRDEDGEKTNRKRAYVLLLMKRTLLFHQAITFAK